MRSLNVSRPREEDEGEPKRARLDTVAKISAINAGSHVQPESDEKSARRGQVMELTLEAWELMTHEHNSDSDFNEKRSKLDRQIAILLASANVRAMSLVDLLHGYHLADTISHNRDTIRGGSAVPRMFGATGRQAERFQEEIDDRMARVAVAPGQKKRAGDDEYIEHLTRDGKILTLRSDGNEAKALRTYAAEKNNLENAWGERRKGEERESMAA